MGLLIGNAGVNAISSTYAVKALLGYRAKRAKDRETEGHEVEAVATTCLRNDS